MKYAGMNTATGKSISDIEHVRQSIRDILITPIGSRIARRQYGSLLSELIDSPQNPALKLQLMSACYTALLRWEPRIMLTNIAITGQEAAKVTVDIDGIYQDTGQPVNYSIPVR